MYLLKTNLLFFILIYCLVLASGCGYKLRENSEGLNGRIISLSFEKIPINFNFATQFKKQSGAKKLYLNESGVNSELFIKIIEHTTTRYSAALGTGARSKEARLDYFLKLSLNHESQDKETVVEIKDSSFYSFDESRILAIEEIEKRIKENFYSNAIKRINFSLLRSVYEDI